MNCDMNIHKLRERNLAIETGRVESSGCLKSVLKTDHTTTFLSS